jgi:integrase
MRLALELERKGERQRLGMEALPTDCDWTVGQLCKWWLDEYCTKRSHRSDASRLKQLEAAGLNNIQLRFATTAILSAGLRKLERGGASPASLNHVRKVLHAAYAKAIRDGIWTGGNPVTAVPRRRVPKRVYETLRAEQVRLLLANVPRHWRNLFAAALLTGLRKGELFGLKKTDVDLEHRIMLVAHSYDRDTTKGGHIDAIPIAEPLALFLADAIDRAPGELVFPRADGTMETERAGLHKILRRALNRAGIVHGYLHVCRRCKAKGKVHEEKHDDCNPRRCPNCNMQLWPKTIQSKMRFHDLRHAVATILLRTGTDSHRVQRMLRHKDVKTTIGTYGHLDVEDLREAMHKFSFVTRLLPDPKSGLPGGEPLTENAHGGEALHQRAIQDSNLWPLAPEANALSN